MGYFTVFRLTVKYKRSNLNLQNELISSAILAVLYLMYLNEVGLLVSYKWHPQAMASILILSGPVYEYWCHGEGSMLCHLAHCPPVAVKIAILNSAFSHANYII